MKKDTSQTVHTLQSEKPTANTSPIATTRFIAEALFFFTIGGIGYYLLEVLFRGHSHISMAICGGICFSLLYVLDLCLPHTPLVLRAIGGALIITTVEFATGLLVNRFLGLAVWDYSDLPFSLLGQICLPFTGLWYLISLPALSICRSLRQQVFTYR